jgi:hypothetical protein
LRERSNPAHVIPAREVQKLIRAARRQSRQVDRRLEPMPSGWSVAPYDPNLLFDAFPRLQLREGFRLAAYQYYEMGTGNGFVFATPAGKWLPEPAQDLEFSSTGAPALGAAGTPLPEWVHAEVGQFLEGDGSPLSYFQASIFMRELQEMGAQWHGCSWSTHEVVTSAIQIPKQKWQWQDKRLRDWRPTVRQNPDGLWRVVFYTHTGLEQERIIRHRDTFEEGYEFDTEQTTIALGEGGYIF